MILKVKVGSSIDANSFSAGVEVATKAIEEMPNAKMGFLYTSVKNDIEQVIKGVKSITEMPIIGCTSSGAIMTQEGIITSENGFAGMLSLGDQDMKVGIACHESGKDARMIGRKVAIEALENAKKDTVPVYFYMVASPKQEEEYLLGIQDVIGRVRMFGGSAADDTNEEQWKIICNDKVISDGVAVAFFFTDDEMATSFGSGYRETNNCGVISEVENERTIVSIDGISALKKYSHWINKSPSELKGKNLLRESITKPLGVKDPMGGLTLIRHPMFGNDMDTKTTSDDTITLGNHVVEGTAILQLEATVDEMIDSVGSTIKDVKRQIYYNPAGYLLMHSAARNLAIGNRLEEVHKQLVKQAKGLPFLTVFTFGEYGYDEHSANSCGSLMLSFTVFGKK